MTLLISRSFPSPNSNPNVLLHLHLLLNRTCLQQELFAKSLQSPSGGRHTLVLLPACLLNDTSNLKDPIWARLMLSFMVLFNVHHLITKLLYPNCLTWSSLWSRWQRCLKMTIYLTLALLYSSSSSACLSAWGKNKISSGISGRLWLLPIWGGRILEKNQICRMRLMPFPPEFLYR